MPGQRLCEQRRDDHRPVRSQKTLTTLRALELTAGLKIRYNDRAEKNEDIVMSDDVSASSRFVIRKNIRPSDNNAAASELLAYAYEYQAFTMKSFADAIITINKNRENQILGLQQKIECLHRQATMLNLKISSQSFTISSEVYTSLKTAAQNENSSMKYIKLRDLLKSSSFNDD
ncbi:uncharacterized protein BDCG_08441 [Blastomyces dermatitidis ER-3]|uniref:Uncharacterized protein n=1 Tax=Ajellomyces dermatitidis (strain ER-3 / ATCC MYA-2586) TaxID=559297 RepID=A0ABP2ENY8_AJEDR|nr:uncharacterized protein BDCG_08441 [Blastomyces dermatitidis ER-3]EEQ85172.2 hypothetical protein BDCG_08441 [Blastomyces dermatitidis ER-3]